MTSEKLIIAGIEDIKSISLECNSCNVRLTFSPDKIIQIPSNCPSPNCHIEWLPALLSGANEPRVPLQMKLISAIVGTRLRAKENQIERPADVAGFHEIGRAHV